jgi:hypothetical protein
MEYIILQNINNRLSELKSKLRDIDDALAIEMQKECKERRFRLMTFLAKEKAVYVFAIEQFQSISVLQNT